MNWSNLYTIGRVLSPGRKNTAISFLEIKLSRHIILRDSDSDSAVVKLLEPKRL